MTFYAISTLFLSLCVPYMLFTDTRVSVNLPADFSFLSCPCNPPAYIRAPASGTSTCTWHLAPGTWHLAPGIWHWHLALAPGTWHLAPGILFALHAWLSAAPCNRRAPDKPSTLLKLYSGNPSNLLGLVFNFTRVSFQLYSELYFPIPTKRRPLPNLFWQFHQ